MSNDFVRALPPLTEAWPEALAQNLQRCRPWVSAARAARADGLATYLERLDSYSSKARVKKVEDVEQRVFDLRRCDAQLGTPPSVRRDGARWRAPFARANLLAGEIFVEVATGRMWAEELPKQG